MNHAAPNVDVVFRFARDSPVEGDGFELPVPREKGSVQKLRRLPSRLESPSVSPKYPSLRRNRRFESIPLLRGVTCEPELSPIGLRRPSGAAAKRPARPSILFPGTLKSPRSPKAKHHTIQTNIGGAAVFVAAAFPKQHDVTRLEFSYCSPLPKLPGGCRQPPASIALCLWGRRFPVARAGKKRDPGLETTGNPVNVG